MESQVERNHSSDRVRKEGKKTRRRIAKIGRYDEVSKCMLSKHCLLISSHLAFDFKQLKMECFHLKIDTFHPNLTHFDAISCMCVCAIHKN